MKRACLLCLILFMLSACAPVAQIPESIDFGGGYSPLSDSWPVEITKWSEEIEASARKYDLPSDLVASIIMMESGGDEQATSSLGGFGLMQPVASDLDKTGLFSGNPTSQELAVPSENIDWGCSWFASHLHDMDMTGWGFITMHGSDELEWAVVRYGPSMQGDQTFLYLERVYEIYSSHQ